MKASPRLVRWWLAIGFSLACCSTSANSQEDTDDELPEYLQGLVAEFDLPSIGSIKRFDHDVMFDWSSAGIDLRAESKSPIKAVGECLHRLESSCRWHCGSS